MAVAQDENDKPRRRFLKRSAALVSGVTLGACASPDPGATTGEEAPSSRSMAALADEENVLEALARVVLPRSALGEDGVARVVESFRSWLEGFEPAAELDHPYLYTDEILYGPPSPAPAWSAQLEALDIEANKAHGLSFRELSLEDQADLVKRQLPRDLDGPLPYAGAAPHVAVGLLAYFYDTREAHDLGYEAAIEEQTCRGLESAPRPPAPSESG